MKKISRIWLSITALAITGLTLSGCTAGGAGDSSRPVIGISVKTITNDPFQQAWVDAATASVKAAGGETVLLTAGGQTAVANQVSQINDLIARRVNALIVNPIDGQAIVPALQRAQSGHIPVIVVDSAVADGNENLYESFIATDNVLAGEQAAKFLTKSLHPTAKVAIVEGAAGSLPGDQRKEGFLKGLNSVGITPVASAAGDWASDKALTVTENILTANPKVSAILTAGGPMVDGIIQALAHAGLTDSVKVVTIDGSAQSIQQVIAGQIFALNTQDPVKMGTLAGKNAVGLAGGKIATGSLEKYVDSGTTTVSSENAQESLANAFK
ncbi:MAG: hypothetical protein B5766_11290 [Candidatus Lumbricidophila eiseniae]|uniref:Periplasmic binding protein domain-containing protein n=1 Tax=Candidatus Lumbricidiphila eiseniae TaxID=1969409 RepID=A0A2A6FNN7_9MICO|nr:MAG: hypothetical protein B5766_11290 [Candidatus Lumbricidophila eiseniae]